MPRLFLPSTLRQRADVDTEVSIAGGTCGEVMRALENRHPELRGWIIDEQGALREHVALFVNENRVDLSAAVADSDRLHVVLAISGGCPDFAAELLVGTRKGLFVLRGPRSGPWEVAARFFSGQTVDYATYDRRRGRYFAAVSHGQFGPRLFYSDDLVGWEQSDGPTFPEGDDASVSRIWIVEPGVDDDELWAGVAPAALFRSADGGRSWDLNRALWDQPSRPEWEGGQGGLALHSICPWPGQPRRLAVAMSAVGVWITEDAGETWRRGGRGLIPRYLPEEARQDTLMLCVHKMLRARNRPETLYLQFHGGVYRSDDAGSTWQDIAPGLPADFGFPIALDPADPDRAFVIPLVSDEDRVTPEGRLRVFATADRGSTWHDSSAGLPQEDAYLTVLRQAFCSDEMDPVGLYFGATSGEVFGSGDGGFSWGTVAPRLPPVTSLRCGRSG